MTLPWRRWLQPTWFIAQLRNLVGHCLVMTAVFGFRDCGWMVGHPEEVNGDPLELDF